MKTILVLGNDQMGEGDRALGQKILATMLRKVRAAFGGLEAIALFNSAVKLVAPDSPVLVEMSQLHDAGVELLPCGTCLEHFGIAPAIGRIADMDSILREIAAADKVVRI
jgi:hypothetical protein